jgi:ferredoxin
MISHQPHRPGAVTVPVDQVRTLLAALGEAAESRRDQAAMCADCADQSCATCHWRLQAADAYDQVAAEMIQAAETSATQRVPSHAAPASGGQHAADREAGQ